MRSKFDKDKEIKECILSQRTISHIVKNIFDLYVNQIQTKWNENFGQERN